MCIPGSVVATETPYDHDDTADGLAASIVEFDDNELLDGGCQCALCHTVIQPGEFVRRTATGEWRHEACSRTRRRRSSAGARATSAPRSRDRDRKPGR